ncbi:MAG TPA: hypothetical protein VFO16_22625 [Pseudonocardiaceae bacterium]|nr:hypothetical protein [Pseudonocardiaceae bacterium]
MTSTADLLAAISAHLAAFELPAIASVRVEASPPGPPVTVQLPHHGPAALAQGLLAWADTLTQITAEAWRAPQGDSVHLSITGILPGGAGVQVYGGLHVSDLRMSTGLEPGATTTVPLTTLRHLATPGQAREGVTLR